METELWPNLLKACTRFRVPILLANARLSVHSYKNYRWIRPLTKDMLRRIDIIAAQSEEDALRLEKLGADPSRLTNSGNIKFDVAPRPDLYEAGLQWRAQSQGRPVWMAASTHPGEEEQVFAAHQLILQQHPNALLILAPRHPDRAERVAELSQSLNLSTERYTHNEFPSPNTQVFIVDVMGQLPKFYRASDVAFVGGSLMPIGGHNIIETACAHAPIIVGPHMFNFTAIADEFKKSKACELVNDTSELAKKVLELLDNPARREALTQAADRIVQKNSGALEKLLGYVARLTKE
jgi:3-deoxy-D-manno-octulosonic-acid transferase